MDELSQKRDETQQEEAVLAAEEESDSREVVDIERKMEGKVAVIMMPGYAESSAGRTETLLKQIAQAQREGVPVSSIYCPPIMSDSGGEERTVSGKKAKKRGRGRPPSKPAELGPDGQPIKRKRGRPRIHPKPEPVFAPDGSPIKRKRGRPRKNPLPDAGVTASPAEDGVVKKRPGRPRKNPLPEEQSEGAVVKDDTPQFPEHSNEATATTDQQLSANGDASALSSSSVGSALPVKRKRGRPRKNPLLVSPIPAMGAPSLQPQVPTVQATSPGVPIKRGRGRPRKHPVEGGAVPSPSTPGKRKRGRQPKNPHPDDASPVKKRRGRPPKAQVAAAVSWGTPTIEKLASKDAAAKIPKQPEMEKTTGTSSKEESSKKMLSITFSDASSDSEWSGAAKVSELATRVATGSMSEEPLAATSGGGGEGKPEESSDESSYISDV